MVGSVQKRVSLSGASQDGSIRLYSFDEGKPSGDGGVVESSSSDDVATGSGTTMSASTFNLIKACVGSGVLSLPAGVAAFSSSPAGLLPASVLMGGLGGLSAYSFYLIGKLCSMTDSKDISAAWTSTFGDATLISTCLFITPLGAALSYSIILGDTITALARTAGYSLTRQPAILGVTLAILYPLCRLKNLAALAPVSLVGVAGIITTCAYMVLRAATGAYLPTGKFFSAVAPALQPAFSSATNVLQPATLVLVSMAATAYLAHFNAPDFYNQLEKKSLPRFKKLTGLGFFATAAISIVMMAAGFLTFGAASSGVILNNYATTDVGATLCRGLMGISVIGSYPFVFAGMKQALYNLLNKPNPSPSYDRTATRVMLACITGLALVLKNAGFVVSFNGAIMGSAIIYIFPSLMFLKQTKGLEGKAIERSFNKFLVALGGILGVCGGVVSVLSSFFPKFLGA